MNFIVESPGRLHSNQEINVNITSNRTHRHYASCCVSLRGTQHHCCGIPAKKIKKKINNLKIIMRNCQTDPSWRFFYKVTGRIQQWFLFLKKQPGGLPASTAVQHINGKLSTDQPKKTKLSNQAWRRQFFSVHFEHPLGTYFIVNELLV